MDHNLFGNSRRRRRSAPRTMDVWLQHTLPDYGVYGIPHPLHHHHPHHAAAPASGCTDYTKFCGSCDGADDVDDEQKKRMSNPSSEVTARCIRNCAHQEKICPCSALIAAYYACEAITKLKAGSRVFNNNNNSNNDPSDNDFTYLESSDISIGPKLGEGGFCNVNQCVVTAGEEAGQEFAIKYMKHKTMINLHQFKHGAADLVVEAYFLQALQHENIVTLHGFTSGSVETNVSCGKERGLFIVIDRLYDTLEQRIEKMHRAQEKENAGGGILLSRMHQRRPEHTQGKKIELLEKMRIAYMIANALEYLHSRNIVYRDLKPDNIAFDKNGVLKLFDFGLAIELKPGSEKENGKYDLTGNTGSRRYMAPEVAKDECYDKSVDTYSFGILLWELCTTEKPFYGYSSGKHLKNVVLGGQRPDLDHDNATYWPTSLKWLMKRCWHESPELRPSFTFVKQVLADILCSKDAIPKSLRDDDMDEDFPEETKKSVLEESPTSPRRLSAISAMFHPHQISLSGNSTESGLSKARSWACLLKR